MKGNGGGGVSLVVSVPFHYIKVIALETRLFSLELTWF